MNEKKKNNEAQVNGEKENNKKKKPGIKLFLLKDQN